MDNNRALEIVEALASGADPFTGEISESQSVFQNPDTVRALFLAASARRNDISGGKAAAKNPELPGKTRIRWSEAEDRELVTAFESGSTFNELAAAHERTRGAIRSRFVRLGKLEIS